MHFIGVTTGQSSINRVFPLWAKALKLGDVELAGMDFVLHDEPDRYRQAINFIKHDPLSLGALVTTHKMDLFAACRDQFDALDELAFSMGEVSSVYKRAGKLCGRPVDHITGGLSLSAFLPDDHWRKTRAEVCILGAGGSSVALSIHLMSLAPADRPTRIVITNRSQPRLDHIRSVHEKTGSPVPVDYLLCPEATLNDKAVAGLAPGSLVVNATGLGKDAPGSPLTNNVGFPANGYVWEFNYRGDLMFLDQAGKQQQSRQLHIEDGWTFFVHGWSTVVADVFDLTITDENLHLLSDLASTTR